MSHSIAALRIAYLLRTERLGRRRIAERTGLSEMSVRLELEQLRSLGFVQLDRSGCQLTTQGQRAFSAVLDHILHVRLLSLEELRIDAVNLAAHLKPHPQLPEAWRLRDEAIREGASGLILLIRANEAWAFAHNAEPVHVHAPVDAERLDETFTDANANHLCLIVSGPTESVCAAGLWRATRILFQPMN